MESSKYFYLIENDSKYQDLINDIEAVKCCKPLNVKEEKKIDNIIKKMGKDWNFYGKYFIPYSTASQKFMEIIILLTDILKRTKKFKNENYTSFLGGGLYIITNPEAGSRKTKYEEYYLSGCGGDDELLTILYIISDFLKSKGLYTFVDCGRMD
jgi:hypothetical protein